MIRLALGLALAIAPAAVSAPGHAHRLVGYGCGADRVTLTADEEDAFPICERIETNPAR